MNPRIILLLWLLSVMLLSSGCAYYGRGYESRPYYYDDYYDPMHPYYVPEDRRGDRRDRFHEEQRDERSRGGERYERGGREYREGDRDGGERGDRGYGDSEYGGGDRGRDARGGWEH